MINNIGFLNFKRCTLPQSQAQFNNQTDSISFSGNNLKPLACDTISFGAKHKTETELEAMMTVIQNDEICVQLHEDAQDAKEYMVGIARKHFGEFVYNRDNNPMGIIEPIQGRVKSSGSIKEKVIKRFIRTIEPKEGKNSDVQQTITTFSPYSKTAMKQILRDISGARVVVREDSEDAMDIVVDKLCAAIREEQLIIDEIEHHVSSDKKVNPYFTKEQLWRIQIAANEVRYANRLSPIEFKENIGDSGYMALHLDVDTTHIGKFVTNRGFYSELQIIGADVAMLKDIEDLCYKLEDGKSIQQKHPSFTPFEAFFKEAYEDEENYPDIKKYFEEYTRKAYETQRLRKPDKNKKRDDIKSWSYAYPTIEECGLKGKIPPILDFNILARLKRSCDDLLYTYYNAQKILDDAKDAKNN